MSAIEYTVYETVTGKISAIGAVSYTEQLELVKNENQEIKLGKGSWDDYVNLTTLEFKPRPNVLEPSALYDLTQLPSGSVVTVTDESKTVYTITDLSELLTLTGPQKYEVKVEPPFPYKAVEKTVEVS